MKTVFHIRYQRDSNWHLNLPQNLTNIETVYSWNFLSLAGNLKISLITSVVLQKIIEITTTKGSEWFEIPKSLVHSDSSIFESNFSHMWV